jgi:hypothetical protein
MATTVVRSVRPVGYISSTLFAFGAVSAMINAFSILSHAAFSFGWLGVAFGLAGLMFLPFVRYT